MHPYRHILLDWNLPTTVLNIQSTYVLNEVKLNVHRALFSQRNKMSKAVGKFSY